MLNELFEKEKIEYFSVLSYSDVRTVNERLAAKLGFAPKSVIMFLVPYYSGETVNISRYAASLDYHIIIKDITERIIKGLLAIFPAAAFAGFGDHSPIAEQHAALISGLGILGDNGLLINEKYGSYVFIGDIITDLSPECLGAVEPREISRCEHCGACLSACPTGILRGDGVDCLSAITQRKGELTDAEAALMREYNTVWGCDACQSVCPHNFAPTLSPVPVFMSDRIVELNDEILSSMSDAEFSRRAFSWRGRAVLERNLKLMKK